METRDVNEIKLAIKYMDYKPAMLSKFYDVKSLLLREMIEDEDGYKVDSIMPNPLNDNKIVKCINILDKKYMKGKEIIDLTKTPGNIPAEAADLLKAVKFQANATDIKIGFDKEFVADMYLNVPRSNSVSVKNMKFDAEVMISVMNIFNTYVTEGFTLALHFENFSISIEPSALDGIKGQGDVFVYVMNDTAVYKDEAAKYFDTADILSVYRG